MGCPLRLSLVLVAGLSTLMLLGGCSSYTTGYYPGRHYGNGVRQHYTNDEGRNVGYTINTRTTGSRADSPRNAGSAVYYSRAPIARGGYTTSRGIYSTRSYREPVRTVSIRYSTLGHRHDGHYPGHYGFGHYGHGGFSHFGYHDSGFGFGFHSGYYGGTHGGHYGGYYGHGSYGGHGYHGHGSHRGHGHRGDRGHHGSGSGSGGGPGGMMAE